ncbi:MAG: DEAD/DEAH box helicase [Clostridia bacterium]|nr:DEAD/DEAH box helicase [Clostridia bacterium]
MKFKPYPYQKTAIKYVLNHPKCGLFLDMGLGKSVTTLTAIKILREEQFTCVNNLIIAPKRVAIDTWPKELEKGFTYTLLTGSEKERIKNLKKDVDFYIISRDLICWLVEYLKQDWFFDTIIIDELSSFKSNSAKRFKSLRQVLPLVKRVIGLTGTPKPNSYMDLWSEIYLLDQGERLEKTITKYRSKYFTMNTFGGFPTYDIRRGADKVINQKIADICISMKAKDYLDLKEPKIIDVPITLSSREMKMYKDLERDYILNLEDTNITAMSGGALCTKLLQLSNGAVYDENKDVKRIHDVKIEKLKEMSEEGENLLVFYSFKSDKERILKAIPKAVFLEDKEDIDRWNRGEIKMLIAHPASAGHGLNLQGGGHIVVWFGQTWSLELFQQANARLHRQGQTEPVIIYRLITTNTIDEDVIASLELKEKSQDALLEKLKARIDDIRRTGS